MEHTTTDMPVRYNEMERKWKDQERRLSYEQKLSQGFMLADAFLTQRYLDYYAAGDVLPVEESSLRPVSIRIFEIAKIVYDPDEQINDKFISVYSSLHNLNSAVALIIRSREKAVHFYIATRSEQNADLAGETLSASLKGNFPGIEISGSLDGQQKRALIDDLCPQGRMPKSLATVSLVPSERDEDKDRFIQGMEKFLSSMNGRTFDVVLLATPVTAGALAERRRGFEGLFSQLSPHAKISMSFAHSETDSVNESISNNFSNSVNDSVSNSSGTSESSSSGSSAGTSSNFGASGDGFSSGFGSSNSSFASYTSGTNFSHSVSRSTGTTESSGSSTGTGHSTGDTDTTSLTFENKSVQGLMERAQAQLKRIDFSECYGMWDFCAYFFSEDIAVTLQAANVYKALMMGQESSVERAHVNTWGLGRSEVIARMLKSVCHLQHPVAELPAVEHYAVQRVTPTNMLNGRELPIVLGFPRKSVPGLAVVEMAEFGRAVVYESTSRLKRMMEFGNIYHMGVVEPLRVPMNLDLLSSHCFITGSSGSGKSYATYQLLDCLLKQDVHMMVIEPAKGEYKQVFGGLKGVRIFTVDPNVYKMLRVNPFQFPENLHVLTHIEKLMQIFNASWSLTAAMPALLKDAVVQAYRSCGWDVMNSVWLEDICDHKYPVFRDVLEILPKLIDQSSYSADAKGDYKGALLTRVQSMTSGITGLIFERSQGIPDNILFDSNAIVDLSDIGSEETVALLMGVLIMRLGEYRQSRRKAGDDQGRDLALNHVTVLEEAHNLLKRTSKDQSQESANIVGKSVEMISNSIKEMRTYGEGFIIIDQSPMAVDTSAIENTSTKIIMNTPARDACEELSSALSLNEAQSRELSRLGTGVAAVFQKGWLTPVLMKIDMWDNRYEAEVKRADPDALRSLRGQMTVELYHQGEAGQYSAINFKKLIRQSELDVEKRRDFEEIGNAISQLLLEKPDGLTAADRAVLYLQILNCEELLEVIADRGILSEEELKRRLRKDASAFDPAAREALWACCARWRKRILQAFPNYAYVDDKDVVNAVMQAIVDWKAGAVPSESPYGTLGAYLRNEREAFERSVEPDGVTAAEQQRKARLGGLLSEMHRQRNGAVDGERLLASAKGDEALERTVRAFLDGHAGRADEAAWGQLAIDLLGCEAEMDGLLDPKLYSPKRLRTLIQRDPEWFDDAAKQRLRNRCLKWRQQMARRVCDRAVIDEPAAQALCMDMAAARCGNGRDENSPYVTILGMLQGGE